MAGSAAEDAEFQLELEPAPNDPDVILESTAEDAEVMAGSAAEDAEV